MILNDSQIKYLANSEGMIKPFQGNLTNRSPNNEKLISYGLSSFGYDIRLGTNFKFFNQTKEFFKKKEDTWVDPKNINEDVVTEVEVEDKVVLAPHGFILGHSLETIKMPKNIIAICLGKSTYARCGLIVNVTPLEPGWQGQITIEISNTLDRPAVIYPKEGIAQLVFFRGEIPAVTYDQRNGKYQGQKGVVLPTV